MIRALYIVSIVLAAALPAAGLAAPEHRTERLHAATTPAPTDEPPLDSIARQYDIDEVEVMGRRPMKQIGVQRTVLDSAVMRDNIASSLADALAEGSGVFIKSYGRATMATASFRGTSPSHTQVTWNGMKLNSPMLGQVDFSLIPSYFIDDAALYSGASSVGITGGGLGGAVALATRPAQQEGFGLRYIQGVGSFCTFDEFLHLTYSGTRWSASTRLLSSTSRNDFRYTNYRTKEFLTDDQGRITGSYYPEERNRNGGFADFHILQEFYYTLRGGDRLSFSAWYLNSHRGLPLLNVDRNKEKAKKNTQDEGTLRAVAGWEHLRGGLKLAARAGYSYTDLLYLYKADPEGSGNLREMIHAQSYVHTVFAEAEAEYLLGEKWMFSASVAAHQHYVRSSDDAVVGNIEDTDTLVSYRQARIELSAFAAVKWRPVPRLGLALNLRGELYGDKVAPVIPALFADYLLSKRGRVVVKASVARNYRHPSLNDLYFRPGGNPGLRPEKGWTTDGGFDFSTKYIKGSATAFWSNIDDWILWINNPKLGICTPINIQRVESYGIETRLSADAPLGRGWRALFDGHFGWTRSINRGEPFSPADQSVGKQLVYIPEFSAAFSARLVWRTWTLGYKWSWYSERYTMSSNDLGIVGRVKPYFMNDLSLEKQFSFRWAGLSIKGCINNLFNEEYESVLSRPMPRQNYAIFIGITPKFRKR